MLLPQTIEKIISLGGGVSIDASKFTPHTLERFATFAGKSGATLELNNCERLLPRTMERIAAFGEGQVIFKIHK